MVAKGRTEFWCALLVCYIYTFCFLIPKIILSRPLKILGLFTNTTFIKTPPLFNTSDTQYDYPHCQYRHQKTRRAKATDEKTHRKSYCHYPLIESASFHHTHPPILHNSNLDPKMLQKDKKTV